MKNNKILGLLLAGVMVTSIPFNVFADDEKPAGDVTKESTEITELAKKNQPADDTAGAEKETPAQPTDEAETHPTEKKDSETSGQADSKDEETPKSTKKTEKFTVNFIAVLVEKGKDNKKETLGSKAEVEKERALAENQFPKTEKDGYEFGGWYTDESLTTGFNKEKTINGPTTVYAKYTKKAKKFTVKFKDEDKVLKSFEVEEGKTVKNTDKPENPTKEFKDIDLVEGKEVKIVANDVLFASYPAKFSKIHSISEVKADEEKVVRDFVVKEINEEGVTLYEVGNESNLYNVPKSEFKDMKIEKGKVFTITSDNISLKSYPAQFGKIFSIVEKEIPAKTMVKSYVVEKVADDMVTVHEKDNKESKYNIAKKDFGKANPKVGETYKIETSEEILTSDPAQFAKVIKAELEKEAPKKAEKPADKKKPAEKAKE